MASPLKLDSYDIIILGAGTAGCVLANRLSKDENLSVLMLEAGENVNDDPRVKTPGLFTLAINDPHLDWQFETEPCPAMNNRTQLQTRGKGIGGSSMINLMALIYPSRTCIDGWKGLGNPNWGWDDLLPYYEKAIRRYPPTKAVQDGFLLDTLKQKPQDLEGSIASCYPPAVDPLHMAWVDTWEKLNRMWKGYPLDSGHSVGGYISNGSVDPEKGERSHAGVEYYARVAHRQNLHVVTGAMIDKVELDTSNADKVVATAVTFHHAGKSYTAKAKKEIILCGGAFGSPAILERSGIGSSSVSRSLGIQNIVDNPNVGENLQDHIMGCVSYEVKEGIPTADMMRDPNVVEQVQQMYQQSRSGPLASPPSCIFANTPLLNFVDPFTEDDLKQLLDEHLPQPRHPDASGEAMQQAFIRKLLESPNEASASLCVVGAQCHSEELKTKDVFAITEPGNFMTMLPGLAHPLSRGSVHIQSADATVQPKIAMNYLDHPLDLEILARHMMQCETIANTPPLSDLLKPGGARLPPGKDALTLERAKDLVKSAAMSNYHPVGTCPMMPEKLGGVVDTRLRVYGVKGLRVCDASIFPLEIRGNIQTTVYAVAEKGSDIILEDLKAPQLNGAI